MTAGDPLEFEELASPSTAEDYRRLAAEALEEATALHNSPDWSRISFRDAAVGLYQLDDPSSPLKVVKIEADFPASPKEMWDFLCNDDLSHRQQWEPELQELRQVEVIDETMDVVFQAYSAPYPITSRSFVALRAKKKLPDGTLLSYGKSINHADCPYNPAFVRGTATSAVYVTPKAGKDYACTVTRIVKIDPKGAIPKWVVNWGINKAGEGVLVLRQVVEKAAASWDRSGPLEEVQLGGAEPQVEYHEQDTLDEEEVQEEHSITAAVEQKRQAKREEPDVDDEGLEFWETSSFLDVEALEGLIKPLQASFRAVEKSTASSADRMQSILENIEGQQQQLAKAVVKLNSNQQKMISQSQPAVPLFGNMSAGAVAFLVAWPVVVVTAYDAYRKYSRRQ